MLIQYADINVYLQVEVRVI